MCRAAKRFSQINTGFWSVSTIKPCSWQPRNTIQLVRYTRNIRDKWKRKTVLKNEDSKTIHVRVLETLKSDCKGEQKVSENI